jgi:hypothetical protein
MCAARRRRRAGARQRAETAELAALSTCTTHTRGSIRRRTCTSGSSRRPAARRLRRMRVRRRAQLVCSSAKGSPGRAHLRQACAGTARRRWRRSTAARKAAAGPRTAPSLLHVCRAPPPGRARGPPAPPRGRATLRAPLPVAQRAGECVAT